MRDEGRVDLLIGLLKELGIEIGHGLKSDVESEGSGMDVGIAIAIGMRRSVVRIGCRHSSERKEGGGIEQRLEMKMLMFVKEKFRWERFVTLITKEIFAGRFRRG